MSGRVYLFDFVILSPYSDTPRYVTKYPRGWVVTFKQLEVIWLVARDLTNSFKVVLDGGVHSRLLFGRGRPDRGILPGLLQRNVFVRPDRRLSDCLIGQVQVLTDEASAALPVTLLLECRECSRLTS